MGIEQGSEPRTTAVRLEVVSDGREQRGQVATLDPPDLIGAGEST
jgi:hypothetical protein